MENDIELVKHLYKDFNARKMDSILTKLTEDVMWANGMDGGYVHGHKDLRDYWERQWSILNPKIEPVSFKKIQDGSILVDALFTGQCQGQTDGFKDIPVGHIFHLKDGLVSRFDIQGRSEGF